MGCRVLQLSQCWGDNDLAGVCLFDSSKGLVFGPVFEDVNAADAFVEWLGIDPRSLTLEQLVQAKEAFEPIYGVGLDSHDKGRWVETHIEFQKAATIDFAAASESGAIAAA